MYGSTSFMWNGIPNDVLKLKSVKVKIDTNKENFFSNRSLKTDLIIDGNYNYRNYLYRAEAEPMRFTCEFGSTELLTTDIINKINRTFILQEYVNFYVKDTDRNYFCIAISGDLNKFLNGYYFTLDFECQTPYSNSNIYASTIISTTTKTSIISNLGDVPCKPIIKIVPNTTGGTIRITNATNSGKYIEFKTDSKGNQLQKDEVITIDFNNDKIETTALGVYRYANLTSSDNDLFDLVVGDNSLIFSGDATFIIYTQYKYLS